MVTFVEIASVAVLGLHWRLSGAGRQRWRPSVAIALGAFVGEEICIRLEGAYVYAPGWHLWIDRLPVAVLCIWPSVVLSASALAGLLAARPLQRALLAGAIAWLDASLMEPLATHAGLWTWRLPGPLHVSWVGPFGWAAYTFSAVWLLERRRLLALPLAAPLLAQALILMAYWTIGRWLPAPTARVGLAVALLPGLIASGAAFHLRRRVRLPWHEALARAAAAGLFFALLALRFDGPLAVLTASIALPYLLLLPPLSPGGRSQVTVAHG